MSFWIGLVSGVFGGMVGMGGGVLMIPLMGRFLKLPQHVCHGTSLVAVVFTGIAGAATYAWFDHVDWTAALLLAAGAFWPVRAGARLCRTMPERNLRLVFGLFLVFTSLLLLARPWLFTVTAASARDWTWVAVLLAGGAVTGFLSGLMGVGGGAFMIAFMVLLAGFEQQSAQGSSLLAMIPLSAIGAWTHWSLGSVKKAVLPGLIPGILIGTVAGGMAAAFLPEHILRVVFAAVLIVTGIRYFRKAAPACPDD
ncbi:MAG TPA: sulfite exporter TauE/SafE family protein [Syntrophales bacterium]|nr:sulfite exporter TauE/SafE family protein [Syntrophales bacterium]